jgi:hypothetical protein
MFKLPKWKAEWFEDERMLEFLIPDWKTELQMAKMPITTFAALTMGCIEGVATRDPHAHLSERGKLAVRILYDKRLRVIENNLQTGNIPGNYYLRFPHQCRLKEAIQWVHDHGWELPAPMLTLINQGHTEKTMLPEEFPRAHPKWRPAYEFESEGMNAIYDLIEKYFIDAKSNPVYDPEKWPAKKMLESDWLITGSRTLREVDLIITSRKRKGRAKK